MKNNAITASRMNSLIRCPRAHYWNCEVGLVNESSGLALRVGSAWHRAMEARWNGATYEQALFAAVPEGIDLDQYACSTIAALLAGYYDIYGAVEKVSGKPKMLPEVQFKFDLENGFTTQGKIDLIERGGFPNIVEHKTTGESIAPDSDYWLRLRFNLQVNQYVDAARKLGVNPSCAYYDVTRKPSIRPKEINDLDSEGLKIVIDSDGNRVYSEKGKKGEKVKVPRLTADTEKGYTVKSHVETPDEFCERLYMDTQARPDFYFCRREIPIIEDEIKQFELQREAIIAMIVSFRKQEEKVERPEDAWPRAVSMQNCGCCSYKSFCLYGISVDLNSPPPGFSVKPFNQELNDKYTDTIESID